MSMTTKPNKTMKLTGGHKAGFQIEVLPCRRQLIVGVRRFGAAA
jgi:hypothetical protein